MPRGGDNDPSVDSQTSWKLEKSENRRSGLAGPRVPSSACAVPSRSGVIGQDLYLTVETYLDLTLPR